MMFWPLRKFSLSALMLGILVIFTSCSTDIPRGHLPEEELFSQVKPGVTTQDEVRKVLGSASSESSFGEKTWYYISSIKKNRSLLTPKITDQRVTEISFDDSAIVKNMRQYTLNDAKDIEVVDRATPTEGQQLGFFEQIFSNLGRFNKNPEKGTAGTRSRSASRGGIGR